MNRRTWTARHPRKQGPPVVIGARAGGIAGTGVAVPPVLSKDSLSTTPGGWAGRTPGWLPVS